MARQPRPLVLALLGIGILAATGAALLLPFGRGDREIIVRVFAVSVVVATVWLVVRGVPASVSGWLVPIGIAFGPAYLLAAYIAVILSTPPGMIGSA